MVAERIGETRGDVGGILGQPVGGVRRYRGARLSRTANTVRRRTRLRPRRTLPEGGRRLSKNSPVDVPTMADTNDRYDERVVEDLV